MVLDEAEVPFDEEDGDFYENPNSSSDLITDQIPKELSTGYHSQSHLILINKNVTTTDFDDSIAEEYNTNKKKLREIPDTSKKSFITHKGPLILPCYSPPSNGRSKVGKYESLSGSTG
jgi:hypothetical protein